MSPGAEEQRLVVPRTARLATLGLKAPLTEVWVVLHGYSQLASRFVRWFAPAVMPGRAIVAPEALNRFYTDRPAKLVGATWMTSDDREQEIRDHVEYLDRVVEHLGAAHGPVPIHVHGFSQGAAMASRWVALGRVRPARLFLWGGGVPPDLDLATHGLRLTQAGLQVIVGDRDQFISEAMVEEQRRRLEAAGVAHALTRFTGGHVIPWNILRQVAGVGPGTPAVEGSGEGG